jgi:hypothetical protein
MDSQPLLASKSQIGYNDMMQQAEQAFAQESYDEDILSKDSNMRNKNRTPLDMLS